MAHILSSIIKKKLPLWNERMFRYEDLPAICSRLRTGYVEAPVRHKGEYTVYDGVPFVIVREDLSEAMKTWVGLHEIGHHLLHYPTAHKFSKSINSKADREANFFAAIAMMPTELCMSTTPAEVEEQFGLPPEIVAIRREITEVFRI